MRIGFASTWGGCAYYRAQVPAEMLAARGWDTAWSVDLDFGTEGGIGFPFGPDPDVVVLCAGWLRTPPDVIRAARSVGQVIVADCDDWPWLPVENPHKAKVFEGREKLEIMHEADGHTVSTEYMRAGLEPHGIESTVCRNVIDPALYAEVRAANVAAREAAEPGPLTIGYRGLLCGFHDADVRRLRGRLPDDARLVHIGADPRGSTFAELADVDPERVTNVPAVAFGYEYFDLLTGVDCAVIPLEDRPFNRAKSNIAALEWTAAGVPWIAEHWHEEFALVAPSPKDWRSSLKTWRDPRARAATAQVQSLGDRYTLGSSTAAEVALAWESAICAAVERAGRHELLEGVSSPIKG